MNKKFCLVNPLLKQSNGNATRAVSNAANVTETE